MAMLIDGRALPGATSTRGLAAAVAARPAWQVPADRSDSVDPHREHRALRIAIPWQSSACTDVGGAAAQRGRLPRPARGARLWAVADGMAATRSATTPAVRWWPRWPRCPRPPRCGRAARCARGAAAGHPCAARRGRAPPRAVHRQYRGGAARLRCAPCLPLCLPVGGRQPALRPARRPPLAHHARPQPRGRAARAQADHRRAGRHHPAQNTVTRALGAAATLETEEREIEAEAGTVFLLCSDGLSNELCDEDIASIPAACGDDCAQAARAWCRPRSSAAAATMSLRSWYVPARPACQPALPDSA